MASIFIGINRGVMDMNQNAITEGASTGATDFELRVDTGKGSSRLDIIRALEAFERYVSNGGMGLDGHFVE